MSIPRDRIHAPPRRLDHAKRDIIRPRLGIAVGKVDAVHVLFGVAWMRPCGFGDVR